jgi:hypothetical protein
MTTLSYIWAHPTQRDRDGKKTDEIETMDLRW